MPPLSLTDALARVKAAAADADKAIIRDIATLTVPGFFGLDPWLLSIIIGAIIADDPSPNPETDRRRPLAEWRPLVRAKLDEWQAAAAERTRLPVVPDPTASALATPPPPTALTTLPTRTPRVIPAPVANEVATAPLPVLPRQTAIIPIGVTDARVLPQRPEQPIQLPPPPPPPALPPGTGTTGGLIPAPPPGMPEPLREAWIQAKVRAGEYARGLGSVIRQWPNDVERETWAGENIVTEVDAETRRAKRQAIRDLTATAVDQRWTPEKLASELGHKTQEWSRNWNRIARTELQAAHNEGVAISALRNDGPEARVARIPESNACADCKRLFLDEDGKPRIFTVAELAENGTNVGKPRADWLPSLFPVHSNCRCGTFAVPNGMTLNANGRLVAE